jgi:hypothetical protein
LNWVRHNPQRSVLRHLMLFNDGDDYLTLDEDSNAAPQPKPIGHTGGFYPVDNPSSYPDVLETMETCMQAGDGSDAPENDLEAVRFALQHYDPLSYSQLLLVADNSAVRDMELLLSFKIPLHIIVLNPDPQYGVHPDYITMAWFTGGAIYTPTAEYRFDKPATPVPPQGLAVLGQLYQKEPRQYLLYNPRLPPAYPIGGGGLVR